MFDLPMINPENVSRDFIDVFGGYNHNLRIGDNEFYDMKNMSSSCYPMLATRQKRGGVPSGIVGKTKVIGMLYRSAFYYVTAVYGPYNTFVEPLTLHKFSGNTHTEIKQFDLSECVSYDNRTLIMMGAYMIILPDKVYVNVEDPTEYGFIEAEFETEEDITVQACTNDGTPITFNYLGSEPPKNPIDGSIWLDTSDTKAVFKKYFASNSSWQSVIANCVLITGEDIDTSIFRERDGIRISGFTDEKLAGLNGTSIIYKIVDDGFVLSTLIDMNSLEDEVELVQYPVKSYVNNPLTQVSAVTVYCKETYSANHFKDVSFANSYWGNDLAVCTSSDATISNTDPETSSDYPYTAVVNINKEYPGGKKDKNLWSLENYTSINRFIVEDQITFTRKMPNMDYVIESNNRLWGCRYGENIDGEFVNEIYASKPGNLGFTNWECFENIATDSWMASRGIDGPWTGAVNFLGHPVFFKENYIETVYGSYPAQYSINSVVARGVQDGSAKSIAILNEILYYMSPEGVLTYNGSLPTNISSAFGDVRYNYAVACAYNDKYYIKMLDVEENPVFMVFDSKRNMWHKEDDLDVREFCPVSGDVYYTFEDWDLRSLFGSVEVDSDPIQWYTETGLYGLSQIDSKYISKLNIRLSLEKGANAIISIKYDSSGVWERVCCIVRQNTNPFTLPIKPRRCDHFQLRIEGTGGAKIYSISKTIEQGSDIVR